MTITDRRRCRPAGLVATIADAVDAGVDAVQLRDKDLDADELYRLALELRRVTSNRCVFVVNGRLDIALAASADGVHLPEHGLPIPVARGLAPPDFLVGRSVHSVEAALAAERDGASYVELGTIFTTDSKPGLAPAGLGLVRAVTAAVHLPCLAVGGVDAINASDVLRAGASGVAVVSAILQAEDVGAAVRDLRAAITLAQSATSGLKSGS